MPQVQWFFIRSEVETHLATLLADKEILFSNTYSTLSLDSVNRKVRHLTWPRSDLDISRLRYMPDFRDLRNLDVSTPDLYHLHGRGDVGGVGLVWAHLSTPLTD